MKGKVWSRILLVSALVVLLLGGIVTTASAADFRSGDRIII